MSGVFLPACRTNFSQWQPLGRDAAAAPRLNCNYGKLLYYVRNCVSIERAIFRAVKLVWRHKWLCCHYPLPAAPSPSTCHLPLFICLSLCWQACPVSSRQSVDNVPHIVAAVAADGCKADGNTKNSR